jgi:N-succinyldiaminopimelate aminotransferase
MLDAIFITTDPGDEIVLSDPTYAGMANRVRIAGAVPRFAPLKPESGEWRLDIDALNSAVNDRTKAIFIGPPALPTGWVLNDEEWEAVASVCRDRDVWLIYFAWFEKVLFDGRPYRHPASMAGMADRTIHVGCVTCEQRMIGWRVGWLVSPSSVAGDAQRAHIYNGLTPSGVCQAGALAALTAPDDGLAESIAEWQRRRDAMLAQLDGLPVVKPAGGWSMIMEAEALGVSPPDLSLALARNKVAATPMTAWGDKVSPRYIRFIFSREPVERIAMLRERLDAALKELA